MASNNPTSPPHFGLAGNFSADDIHELLGAMSEDHLSRAAASSTGGPGSVTSSSGCTDATQVKTNGGNSQNDNIDNDAKVAGVDGDESKAQARSERKRSREKKRRCDVNKQFADLTQLLREIEGAEEDSRLSFSPSNRVDLIARTITYLERFRDTNKRQKTEIDSLTQQLDQAKKAGEDTAAKLKEAMFNQPPQSKQVMMMVPMMMPADGSGNFGGGMAMMNSMGAMAPMMMPQPFMTPQMGANMQSMQAMQNQMQQQQQQHHHQQQHQQPQQASMQPQHAPAQQPQQQTQMPQQHQMFPMVAQRQPGMAAMMPQQQQQQMQVFQQRQQQIQQPQQAAMPFVMQQPAAAQMMQQPVGGVHNNNSVMSVNNAQAQQPTPAPQAAAASEHSDNTGAESSSSTTNEQKSPSQQGMNRGSNLAHCA